MRQDFYPCRPKKLCHRSDEFDEMCCWGGGGGRVDEKLKKNRTFQLGDKMMQLTYITLQT